MLCDNNPWYGIRDGDGRARALLNRHYSAIRYKDGRKPLKCVGPGEYMLLMTADSQAVFGWVRNTKERKDQQVGLYCPLFRNEGPYLSSDLILYAEEFASHRWPDIRRMFTYVDGTKILSPNPGYCFKVAGWQQAGRSASGKILLVKESAYA